MIIQNIRLLFNAKEIGVYNRIFADYNFKQIHLNITENDGITNKIFKIYYYEDLIISTYEKNYIFFINISLPICKICERVFDYLRGIHSFNLDYSCDCDSKFGLYDYSLLINDDTRDIFSDEFIENQDILISAVDNLKARKP